MDIKDTVECASATSLTRLLVKEAVTSVKSAVSCNSQAEGFMESEHVTSHHRLDVMVGHAIHMLRTIGAKMKDYANRKGLWRLPLMVKKGMTSTRKRATSHLAPLRPQRQGLPSQKPQLLPSFKPQRQVLPTQKPQRSTIPSFKPQGPGLPSQKPQLLPSFKPQRQGLPTQKPQRSTIPSFKPQGPSLPSQKPQRPNLHSNRSGSVPIFPKTSASSGSRTASSGLEDSIGSNTSRMVEDIITKEFLKITEPLMDSMTQNESNLLRADTVEEIAELTQFIVKESLGAKSNSMTTIEEVEPKIKKNICGKIKAFLTRRVAKLTIHRMLSGLKATFLPWSKS
ncbi:hypothetical protein F7725_027924 [Dissostichus mawsoni]|uniref:Uncharacterized protein n=1 Tax=Dissostichus mawsoni TaxID=36200 RepID=A0A7J5XEA2_DISMA|nr:hypothetical protein F7725_027924 [Dissostichus mawsoni]